MTDQIGVYMRYTTEEHKNVVFGLGLTSVIVGKTYEEASNAAILYVVKELAARKVTQPVHWYYHPHQENTTDPYNLSGSWGWKTVV